jgi:N-acyl homoserine lactone hydrolase
MKFNRNRVAKVLVGVVVASIVAIFFAVSYRPILVVGPVIEPRDFSLRPALPGLRLHVFNTGANRMSSLLVGPAPPWRAAPAFIIEHPTRGLVAFDLGLSHEVAERGEKAIPPPVGWLMESRGRVALTLEAQMREDGLSPAAVGHVVISHLHSDHTGVIAEFADAVFLAGPGTREQVRNDPHSPFDSGTEPDWREVAFETDGKPVGLFDKATDLFGDGSILLIAGGGGHTPEDVMALVNLASGAVLLTGDAVVHFDWLESDDVERIASDPERAAATRNRVRAVRDAGDVLVIPGHDLRRLGPARNDLVHHRAELFEPAAWPISND